MASYTGLTETCVSIQYLLHVERQFLSNGAYTVTLTVTDDECVTALPL